LPRPEKSIHNWRETWTGKKKEKAIKGHKKIILWHLS
jgi:hypothetical protein